MQRHLVLVGGGHAHLAVLVGLDRIVGRGHRVTLISPDPYHYYSGMGPGLIGGFYQPREIRFHVEKTARERGGEFVRDVVVAVDPARRSLRLGSGGEIYYDVVSFNTGSLVPSDNMAEFGRDVVPVKPIVNLIKVRKRLAKGRKSGTKKIIVVGGGPAGVEMAGNLRRLTGRESAGAQISLIAGRSLLPGFPRRFRLAAKGSLVSRGVEVREGTRVVRLAQGEAESDDGTTSHFDLALVATGVIPSPLFKGSGLPTGPDGGLLVNKFLQGVSHPEIFGGGDCICFQPRPLNKVGVFAVRQNPVLYHNLLAALEEQSLRPFRPQRKFLLILNLGDGQGLLHRGGLVWCGRTAFRLKDYIDRGFMKRFQVSGEAQEPDIMES